MSAAQATLFGAPPGSAQADAAAKQQVQRFLADMVRTALISDCGRFRYRLGRRWADGPTLLFVMLNPSKADHLVDDRTIMKCVRFAIAHGFGGLEVVNLFAYRTKDPRELKAAGWPVGLENDRHIGDAALAAGAVCLAWGAEAARTRRPAEVLQLLRDFGVQPQCLRLTKSGHPEHPLYLPGALRLKPFDIQAIDDAMQGAR